MGLEGKITGKIIPLIGGIVADFIENYDTIIRPAIIDGNIAGANAVIMEACLRFGIAEEDRTLANLHPRAYASYRMALTYLKGIATGGDGAVAHMTKEKTRDSYLDAVERQVAELDIIMSGLKDEEYLKRREKFKHLF